MSNSISEAFRKLNFNHDSDEGDHEKIYTISYEYLSKVKQFNDYKAFKNCLVSLIIMDKYGKAEILIKKIPNSLIEELILEIAYIYYKLGKSQKVIDLHNKYKKIDNEGIKNGLKHIVAQNYYKIGQYQNALDLYDDLIKINKYDNKNDLIINERAVISQINFNLNKKISSNYEISDENYDLFFNEALIHLSNKNLSQSLFYLSKAETLCQQQNSDSQDLLTEILPIKLTQAYIYQIQGVHDKSLQILSQYDLSLIEDDMLKLIIKNNTYAIKLPQHSNVNLLERDLNYQPLINKLTPKLTKFQYQTLLKNNIYLKFITGTINKIDNGVITQYLSDFPGDCFPLIYYIFLKLEITYTDLNDPSQYKPICRKLIKFIRQQRETEQKYDNIINVSLLLLVFINSKQHTYKQSLPILKKEVSDNLQQEKLIPGLISILIDVYEKYDYDSQESDLKALYSKLIDKFLNTDMNIISQDFNYYNFISMICLKAYDSNASIDSPLNSSIREILETLLKINPDDKLISAFLDGNEDGLDPIDQLLEGTDDIENILQTNLETLLPAEIKKTPIIHKIVKKNKTKPLFSKNKVLVPKEELTLDEERWLPMKLRSYYKPTKKDRKKTGGHQGAFESTPVPSVTPTTTNTSSTSKSKKKKKGKK